MMADTGARMMGQSLERDIGGLDARVTGLEKRVGIIEREIKAELRVMNEKFDRLDNSIVASTSSRKAVISFLGVVATLVTIALVLSQLGVLK